MNPLDATARLVGLLDEMAVALAAPDADALLALEARLASALTDLAPPFEVASADRPRLAGAVARAGATLARCQVLATSLSDAARLSLDAQGLAGQYGRSGGQAPVATGAARGHRLHARL